MNLHEYIEKLRAKPVRERERIAVIATAVGFAVIFLIWIVSFNEMNKPVETQADPTSASLNDLKNNFQTGKDSIQNMMQQLPGQTGATGTDDTNGAANAPGTDTGGSLLPAPDGNLQSPTDSEGIGDNSQNMNAGSSAGTNPGAPPNNNPSANSGVPNRKNNSVPQLP
ncbi:MAG: hypothetical protein NT170_03385 [Candidatus Moranbacteria bacterium]|nr:hypothetical protein [Candidatus Moranbacteria bacterium]